MAGGRPSKYKPEFTKQAFKLALLGAKDTELAAFFEVNQDTIVQWRKTIPEFSESLKVGKMEADTKVSKNLYRRALGFRYNEVTFEDTFEPRVDHKGVVDYVPVTKVKTVRKQALPDTTAQIFWLKNRQSDKWRDRQELGVTLAEDQVFEIAGQKIKFG
jgi:hypothetical protein